MFLKQDIIWLCILYFSDSQKYSFAMKWWYCIENSFKKHEGNSNEKKFITGKINTNFKKHSMRNMDEYVEYILLTLLLDFLESKNINVFFYVSTE